MPIWSTVSREPNTVLTGLQGEAHVANHHINVHTMKEEKKQPAPSKATARHRAACFFLLKASHGACQPPLDHGGTRCRTRVHILHHTIQYQSCASTRHDPYGRSIWSWYGGYRTRRESLIGLHRLHHHRPHPGNLLLSWSANLTNNYLSWRILSYDPPRSGLNVVSTPRISRLSEYLLLMPPGALEMTSSDRRSLVPKNDMSFMSFSCVTGVKTIVVLHRIRCCSPNLSRLHHDHPQESSCPHLGMQLASSNCA